MSLTSGLPAFIARSVLLGVVTLLFASLVVFLGVELLPGDAATAVSSGAGQVATPEELAALRLELGLDRPLFTRYLDWLAGAVVLDFGQSAINQLPVSEILGARLLNTAILVALTLAIILPITLILGVVCALREGGRLDSSIQLVTLTAVALPEFVVGVALILPFAVVWPILPPVSFDVTPASLVLPVATLSLVSLAYTARMIRAGVADVVTEDYVAMARLKGLPERKVIRRHILPNAIGPTLHTLPLTIAWLAGGVVVVEELFAYPGIGTALVDAVGSRDAALVEAVALIIAAIYVIGNVMADIATVVLTPRLRTEV